MMGKAHAWSGAAVWLVAAPPAAAVTGFDLHPGVWVAGAIVTAGAALAPDLDHPSASSARGALGPVTRGISNIVGLGGHRTVTHSWLGTFITTAMMVLGMSASRFTDAAWAEPLASAVPLVFVFFLVVFAAAVMQLPPKRVKPPMRFIYRAGIGIGGAIGLQFLCGGNWGWLLFALPLGLVVHIIGDMLTVQGCPVLWPMRRDYRLATMRAGGPTERFFLTPLFIVAILVSLFFGVTAGELFGYPTTTAASPADSR